MYNFKTTYLKNGNVRHFTKEFSVILNENKIIVYLKNTNKTQDQEMHTIYNAAKICLECKTCKYKIACNKIIPFESGGNSKMLLFHSAYCKYLNDLNKDCILYNQIEKSANKFCKFKTIKKVEG